MRYEWKVLSICDIVLNHTANESPWLQEHPECTYNMETAPHILPAALLDAHLHLLTMDVSAGKLKPHGIPSEVYLPEHINVFKNILNFSLINFLFPQALKFYMENELVPNLKLEQIYTCDVEETVSKFLTLARTNQPTDTPATEQLKIIPDARYRRNAATIDFQLALRLYNNHRNDVSNEEERLAKNADDLRRHLYSLNNSAKDEINSHLHAAINNCIAGIQYFRLQDDGPKLREVSEQNPLVPRYFTGDFKSVTEIEEEIYSDRGRFIMAHNGWVMNCDPLQNFAAKGSNVYIRRELIAWGDSVKLR